jgi:prepilin-type N-terminal cleavage/methylation domain-containing protein
VKTGGFTLIELSIVLVIIGLIVGGVLVGRDLIRSAAVRAEISQLEKYTTAVNTFRGKYDCLPGDCINATTFFGATAPNGNTVYNGNGDSYVDAYNNISDSTPWLAASEEYLNVFPQLGMANLVEGTYSNVASTKAFSANMPLDKIGRAGIIGTSFEGIYHPQSYQGTQNEWLIYYPSTYNMTSGIVSGPTGGGDVITPGEAYQIDKKIDDGLPGSGKVQGMDYNGPIISGGTTDNCLSDTNYNSATTYIQTPAKVNNVSCVLDVGWDGLKALWF